MRAVDSYSVSGRTYRNSALHVRDLVHALRAHRQGDPFEPLQVTVDEGRELSLTARILLR